jgi:hypothetical protein
MNDEYDRLRSRDAMAKIVLILASLGWVAGGATWAEETYTLRQGDEMQLTNKLVLRAEYGGVAGVTGRKLTIAKDGKWTYERFRVAKNRALPPVLLESGKLSPGELASLADVLQRRAFVEMPKSVGSAPKANPQRLSLKFGKHRTTIEGLSTEVDERLGPQLAKLADDDPESKEVVAFAEIVGQLEKLTVNKKDARKEAPPKQAE